MKLKTLNIALDLLRAEAERLEAEYNRLDERFDSVPEDSEDHDWIVDYRRSVADRLYVVRCALRDLEEFEIK